MKKIRTCKELVDIIELYCDANKISRRQFCKLTSIPSSTIASWKSKNVLPSIELVSKIADIMNVSLDSLVFESNEYSVELLNPQIINQTIISIYSDLDSIKEKLSKIEVK